MMWWPLANNLVEYLKSLPDFSEDNVHAGIENPVKKYPCVEVLWEGETGIDLHKQSSGNISFWIDEYVKNKESVEAYAALFFMQEKTLAALRNWPNHVKEGESTLSDITDAAKTAAETAATAVATELANQALAELTKTDDDGQTLIEKGTALITKLTKEIGTTNDGFVKFIRNPAEIVVLTGLIAGAGAGVASAISELKDKLK